MAQLIQQPTRIQAAGNKPKLIDEYVGRVNSQTPDMSLARMQSPSGWQEPGQTPEFDEYTIVLRGMLRVETKSTVWEVHAGQAIVTHKGEWVRYSTPGPDGAEYIAVCLPRFLPPLSIGTLHEFGATAHLLSLLALEVRSLGFHTDCRNGRV